MEYTKVYYLVEVVMRNQSGESFIDIMGRKICPFQLTKRGI